MPSKLFYYAEICADLGDDQYSIWLGPFVTRVADDTVFEIARTMGLGPVETCAPFWKQRSKKMQA